jgi:hypothetical protein
MSETMTDAGALAGIAALLVLLGTFFKSVPGFPDKWIPTALSLVGCGVALYMGGVTLPNAIQGLSAGLTAVGANQLFRQHTVNDTPKPPTP